jgi:shikimate dehydrogenase
MVYSALLVELDGFTETLRRLQSEGVKGANVTLPFKQEAWRLMNSLSPRAEQAKAVNTIVFANDGQLIGDNTDGLGLVADLKVNHTVVLTGKRILLLGAGGASRGVINPLLLEQPAELVIANRTVQRAHELVSDFSVDGKMSACGFSELAGQHFDVVINATSASLSGSLPPLPPTLFNPGACAYDMMYGNKPTVFMKWAGENGAEKVLDGLGMLVEQAAEAFLIWRGVRPETSAVIKQLRAKDV